MLFSTILNLFFIPVLYVIVKGWLGSTLSKEEIRSPESVGVA
jgi:hypothetical protein